MFLGLFGQSNLEGLAPQSYIGNREINYTDSFFFHSLYFMRIVYTRIGCLDQSAHISICVLSLLEKGDTKIQHNIDTNTYKYISMELNHLNKGSFSER